MPSTQSSTAIEDQANTLAHDFEDVMTDAQELFATMGAEGGAKLAQARKRAQAAVATTDQYVHDNPWSAIGIGAGIGLVVGYLVARRPS